MRLTTRLTRKRAALLVRFLDKATEAAADPHAPNRFVGMDEADSRQVRYVLDTIYNDCANTQGGG